MKNFTYYIYNTLLATLVAVASGLSANAQASRTGFFAEGYTYRYLMNPAYGNESQFIAIPVIGNLNARVEGTLGLDDVIYNVDGHTTTFMNPGVSAEEVLGKLEDKNRLGAELDVPVIAFGFKGMGGYNTVTVSAHASTEISLPRDLFSLLKQGISNRQYNIGNIDAYSRGYAQIALGHSHDINEQLRIGANLKLIAGAANVRVDINQINLDLGTDNWRITSEGQVDANLNGLKYKSSINQATGKPYVDDIEVDDPGLAGFGVGVDLGIVYKPTSAPGLELSAAVTDIGFIRWNCNVQASTQGKRTFETDKYTFNVDKEAPNNFDDEFDRLKDDLTSLFQLSDMGDIGSTSTALGATINIGAQYSMPFYKQLSLGLLNTTRINGDFSWNDLRLSANWAPCSVFNASVSASTGTFGYGLGALLNLHCRKGINLFAGSDNLLGKYSKDGYPLSSRAAVNLGLNITF